MARAFVNTDLGQPERVQTVARPTGISAPIATIQPTPGMALASSLASLSPKLQEHIQTVQGWHQEDEANRAYDTIQGMTHAEAKAAVDAGTMRDTESPWFRAAFQKQFGLAHAAERRRQIMTDYNTSFDKDGGDLDAFLKGYVQEDLQAYGGSEFILAGLREGMGNTLSTIRDQHAEYSSSQLQARAVDQFYSVAGASVDATVAAGGDVNAALQGIYADHTNALGLTPDQMDVQAMSLAKKYASEGNVDAVNAILTADPAGRGAFTSRADFALDAQELLGEANKARAGRLRTENTLTIVDLQTAASDGKLTADQLASAEGLRATGQITQEAFEGLLVKNSTAVTGRRGKVFEMNVETEALNTATSALLSGKGAFFVDQEVMNPDTGTAIKINGQETIDKVVNEQIEGMLSKNATPQVIAAQLGSWGVSSTYKPWENVMTNGVAAISTQLATLGPDGLTTLPEPAVLGYELYKGLSGQRQVRDRHIKDATAAAIYRDAEVLEQVGGITAQEALLASARIDRKEGRGNLTTSIDRDKFEAAARKVIKGGFWEEDAANGGVGVRKLEDLARIRMDLGIPMDAALTSAAEDVANSFTMVGGMLVNTRDKFIPPDFAAISQVAIENYAASVGRDADEFRLFPADDQDYWIVQELDSLTPARGIAPVHISQLQKNPNAYGLANINEGIRNNR
jgi:hypothetical protein